MRHHGIGVLVALLIAICGGCSDPTEQAPDDARELTATTPQPSASSATPVETDPDAVPATATGRFQLKTHYERLSPTQPTSSSPAQVEVTEVFWYGCPHCFSFEPYVATWLPTKADYVNFVRLPAVWNPVLRLHARAFYTAEELDKGAEMHDAFFREIHVSGNALDDEAELRAFFGRFGVDEAAFKTAFDSFKVHEKLQRADELTRRYQISSVPTIVINGKYTTDGSMAGGYDALLELVNELSASERAAN